MKKGFTLVELTITLALVGMISMIVSSVFISGYRTFNDEITNANIQASAQNILDKIITDTKNGMLIETSYYNGSTGLTYTTGTDEIIIRVPAINAAKEILYDGSNMRYDRIIYTYENDTIHRIVLADENSTRYALNGIDRILSKKVLSLTFEYDPDQATATLVTATIKTGVYVNGKNKEINLSGKARLRNHI